MRPHGFLLLFLLAIPGFAQQRIPKEIREQLLINEKGLCSDERTLKATWVDLNGDRISEIIVKVENSCHCDAQLN